MSTVLRKGQNIVYFYIVGLTAMLANIIQALKAETTSPLSQRPWGHVLIRISKITIIWHNAWYLY